MADEVLVGQGLVPQVEVGDVSDLGGCDRGRWVSGWELTVTGE